MFRIVLLLAFSAACVADLSWDSMNSPNMQRRIQQLMKVAGPLECVDVIVDDFIEEFPELRPPSDAGIVALKRQLNYFFTASRQEQDHAIRGNSSKFGLISEKITQLKQIAKRELKGKKSWEYEDEDHFITSHLISSMVRLHHRRVANHVQRGLNERLVKMEIEKKQAELFDSWHGDIPEGELKFMFGMEEHHKLEL